MNHPTKKIRFGSLKDNQPPENQTNQTIWRYEIDETWIIEVQVASRPKTTIDKQQLRPPRTLAAFMGKGEPKKNEGLGSRPVYHAHRAAAAEPPATPRGPTPTQNNSERMDTDEQNETRGHGSRSPRRQVGTSQTIPATALDPPSPDPSHQAAKQAKLSPSKSFYPPCDPEDAVGKGWFLRDMGGEGDCFYRCAGTHVSKDPPKITTEGAKIQGRFVRVKVVEHVRKHQKKFAEIFESDEKFEDWCQETAKSGAWVEGTALQAFSERYGVPVIIWSHKPTSGLAWLLLVVAPRFSSGVACGANDCVPLCLQLKDQHYQILNPPDQGKIPSNWLKETPNVVVDLRGAGRSFVSAPPSEVTNPSEVCPTPSVHTMMSGSGAPHSTGTPSVATIMSPPPVSQSQAYRSSTPGAGTPSVHTPLPRPPGQEGSSHKVDESWVTHDHEKYPEPSFGKTPFKRIRGKRKCSGSYGFKSVGLPVSPAKSIRSCSSAWPVTPERIWSGTPTVAPGEPCTGEPSSSSNGIDNSVNKGDVRPKLSRSKFNNSGKID